MRQMIACSKCGRPCWVDTAPDADPEIAARFARLVACDQCRAAIRRERWRRQEAARPHAQTPPAVVTP